MAWIRDRALTLVLMAMFLLFLAGQLFTGFAEHSAGLLTSAKKSPTAADVNKLPVEEFEDMSLVFSKPTKH